MVVRAFFFSLEMVIRGRFLFFIFVFYKNIFSIWKFTGIYPGRPAAGRQEHF